jgi:beta-lactamase regulating signal transducer with metallopeptidase domain
MGLFEVSNTGMLAIGKTIVHSIWVGVLILAILRLTLAHIPARLSGLRYSLAVSSLCLLFFSVIAVFLLIYEPSSSGQGLLNKDGIAWAGAGNKLIPNIDAASNSSALLLTVFGYLYLAGILFMLFRSLRSLSYFKELQKGGKQPGAEWQARFSELCDVLKIKGSVEFLESNHVSGPLLVAYLKPAVIVPAGMLTNLPVNQIETILMHELYHLKRKDYLINLMQLFIEGVLFYHPVVWLISGYIRSEREHCCDDQVVRSTDNPVDYAKALIHIAEQQQFTRLAPGAVGSDKNRFYTRIKRILNHNTMKTNMRDKVLALSLLAGSLLLLLIVSGFSAAPSFMKDKNPDYELVLAPVDPPEIAVMDTIPEESPPGEIEEPDWEEIKEEMREVREEALREIEEIDWEEIEEEMREAREEALMEIEEIDWEEIEEEMREAREEALREIEEIDWEEIEEEMREVREEALREIEEIDWEELRAEMKLDMEKMRIEIKKSMDEINWDEIREQIKEDLEEARMSLDSIMIELDM